MMVMPANNSSCLVGWLAGTYPGRLGHLYSPGGFRGPYEFLPYALDNGRYIATTQGTGWDEATFLGMVERAMASGHEPGWILVPDAVADRDETLREWDRWAHRLAAYGRPLAFAAQDGMTFEDVPREAAVVFLGGSTEWKRRGIWPWCQAFPRVHVGRINTDTWLWECHAAGAESCDGTGWMRGDKRQLAGLMTYLRRSADGKGPPQGHLRDLMP